MTPRKLRSLYLFLITLFLITLAAAPLTRASAADQVTSYLQARQALTGPILQAAALSSAQQTPSAYLGQIFEVTGTVGGLVTADGERTVLLSLPGGAVTARLPLSGAADDSGIDSGQTIRALLRVERTGNDMSLSNLRLLAAAPEASVAAWERRQALLQQARTVLLPSRSLAYQRPPVTTGTTPGGLMTEDALLARAGALYWPYRTAIQKLNPRLPNTAADKITRSILYFSAKNRIDPRLIVAMIIAESGFHLDSTSRTGAMGLGQLMPSTARGLGVTDAYDPIQNIAASAHILRGNLDKYGGAPADAGVIPFDQIALTMAAYNAGSGAVHKYHGVPPYKETKKYVAKVAALYKQMLYPSERAALR